MIELINDKEFLTCTKCNETFPATEDFFYKQKYTNKKGTFYRLAHPCKKCRKEVALEYVMNNREQNEANRAKYRKTQKYRQKVKETSEKLKDYYIQWRKENPEYFRDKSREWQLHKHHEISKQELEELYAYCNSSCMYCGITEQEHKELHGQRLHKDHAVNKGSNGIDNCVLACRSCNVSKWDRDWFVWYTPDNPKYTFERYIMIEQWLNSFNNEERILR